MRLGAELRGSTASLSCAAKRSSIESAWFLVIALRRARRAANFFAILRRFSFFSTELFFAMGLPSVHRDHYDACLRADLRNGKLNASSSARASSSVLAVVQTITSRPQTRSILS